MGAFVCLTSQRWMGAMWQRVLNAWGIWYGLPGSHQQSVKANKALMRPRLYVNLQHSQGGQGV